MTVSANAKVNLTLEVFDRRPDGYHALRSLVAPITLADTLDVEPTDNGTITSDTGFADDLCVRAAVVLRNACGGLCQRYGSTKEEKSTVDLRHRPKPIPSPGVRICVTKRIPIGGGLGGGSADAAATLRALNGLWHLGKTPEELAEIGAAVGSDVPALVLAQHYRSIILMEGRGEKVTPLPTSISTLTFNLQPPTSNLILANPGIAVSTAAVYRLCTARTEPASNAVNDLQAPAVALHPEIARTLEALRTAGATDVMMSGSGATCFGFAADEAEASRIATSLSETGLRAWACRILV